MKRILASLMVLACIAVGSPAAMAQNTSGNTAPGEASNSGQSTQSSYPGTIPETRVKGNFRFPNQAIFGGNQTVQDPANWSGLASPIAIWSNIPSIVLRPYGKKPTDNLDTYINWTTPSGTGTPYARLYTIPDAGANANFLLDHGNPTIAGTWIFSNAITAPSLILTGTSFNGTLSVISSLGQATAFQLPDPGAASDNIVDTGAAQSVSGIKTFAKGAVLSTMGSTATYNPSGRLFSLSATSSSSTGGAVNTTYSLPASTLTTTGQGLRVKIHGTTAANGNTKACNFKWGATPVTITLPLSTGSGKDFWADILIYRTGASAQQISVAAYANAALANSLSTTAAETETNALNMQLNLPTSTGAADVVVDEFTITAEQ